MSTSTTCKYTLTDGNGTSNEATITVEVTPPEPSEASELVFHQHSAQHQPIASGASIAGESHAETQALRAVMDKGWTYNRGGPWGVQSWISKSEWTSRTITWAPQNETNQAMAVNYPLTMKLPPPRTGSSITDWQPDNLPVKYPAGWTLGKSIDGVVCIFDDSTKMWRLFRQVVWQPFQSNVTANQTFVHSATGLGHPASPSAGRAGSSASGVFNVFGLLKGHHINQPGRAIPHGLQCIMSARAAPYALGRTFVPPAISTDGAANQPGRNLGPIPYGRRLTLPHGTVFTNTSFQVPGGPIVTLNEPTLRVAMAIFIYGLFPIDMDHPGIAIRTDQWVSATVISQLLAHSGRIFPYLVPCLEVWQPNQIQCGPGTPRGPNLGYAA